MKMTEIPQENDLIIHIIRKRLEYLQKELVKAKRKTKETEIERNYLKFIGAEIHIEEMIKQTEEELNITNQSKKKTS